MSPPPTATKGTDGLGRAFWGFPWCHCGMETGPGSQSPDSTNLLSDFRQVRTSEDSLSHLGVVMLVLLTWRNIFNEDIKALWNYWNSRSTKGDSGAGPHLSSSFLAKLDFDQPQPEGTLVLDGVRSSGSVNDITCMWELTFKMEAFTSNSHRVCLNGKGCSGILSLWNVSTCLYN